MKSKSKSETITSEDKFQLRGFKARLEQLLKDVYKFRSKTPKNSIVRETLGEIYDAGFDQLGHFDDLVKDDLPKGNTSFSVESYGGTDPE